MIQHSKSLLCACLATVTLNGAVMAADPPFDVTDVREVRFWLFRGDPERAEYKYLIRMGEKAFPLYEVILAAPETSDGELSSLFGHLVWSIEADRRRFIKYALARLTHEKVSVRHSAIAFLRTIGSHTEASPIIALLSDENKTTIPYAAARALADIGGPNEVVAMDVWLRSFRHHDDPDSRGIREYVQEHRNKLKKRLADEKDPKTRTRIIQQSWKDLRIAELDDQSHVHSAVRILTRLGADSANFLKERVRPVPAGTQKQLEQLLIDLDSNSFDRREAATRELSRGVVVEEVLEKALTKHPSLELRRRLEATLEDMPNWKTKNPELLQQVRAVWVLQQIGTPEAKALLEKLAAGAPSARPTQKAKDALQSLNRLKKQ